MTPQGLCRLTFPTEPLSLCEDWVRRRMPAARQISEESRFRRLAEELTAYLEGALRQISTPVLLCGTPFQLQVWTAVQSIGYGEVRTYAQIGESIGRPGAVRAVGAANGANPVPIIVPCHRVIGASGSLTGYAGGLDLKRRLLELEGAHTA